MQYTNLNWRNGQPYSEMFDDIYYSSDMGESVSEKTISHKTTSNKTMAGETEFKHVFFSNNGLPGRWSGSQDFVIAELGFGSGLNCLLTIREWLKHVKDSGTYDGKSGGKSNCLHYIAIEKYPLSPESITAIILRYPELDILCTELIDTYPPAVEGAHSRYLFDNRVMIHYKFMDAYETLRHENFQVDAWYLDGFSPAKNTDMWSPQLFEKIAQNSHNKTTCCTYTAAGYVKRNMQSAGFEVSKIKGFGKKREMLFAEMMNYRQGSNHKNSNQKEKQRFIDKPWFSAPAKPDYTNKHATIIGAGIAGLSVAYSLVKRGWTVTVIDDHGEPARATSSNPAAIIYPRLSVNNDVDTEFNTQAYCYALYILKTLQLKYQKKFWIDCGLFQLIDKKRISEISNKFDFNEDFVALAEDYNASSGAASCKQDTEDLQHVCVEYKSAGVVIPRILCDVLVHECGDRLKIVKAMVDDIKQRDNHWQCYNNNCLIHETEILVIANGVHLNNLSSDISFPVESVRGQAVALSERRQSKGIINAINAGVYLTPLINNHHYLGATYSRDNDSIAIDEQENTDLLAGLNELYPGVFTRECIKKAWVGFRATSKDRVPITGAINDRQFYQKHYADIKHGKRDKLYQPAKYLNGLYISAAHGSRGFTTSFLCAEVIASQVEGSPMPVSKTVVDLLNPSRFIVNDLKHR